MSDAPTVTLTGRGRWPVFAVLTLVALWVAEFIIINVWPGTSISPNA